MRKKKKATGSRYDFGMWFGLALTVLIFGFFLRPFVRRQREENALAREKVIVKAIIIEKKNFFGNSPVSRQFAYSYRFSVQGQTYEGNSRDPDLQVGDSIMIEYVPSNPSYNQVQQKQSE